MATTISPERLARLLGPFDRSPAYRGLCAGLQELIGDGRIPLGTRLPSERALTSVLGVSRTTVTRAYTDLVAAGFAASRQGSGTYATVPVDRRRAHDRALEPIGGVPGAEAIDLTVAASAATPGVVAAYERAVAALPAYLSGDGYLPSGLPELQAAVAESYAARGLPTQPEQIVITSGALSAIAIVARALSRSRDRVMVESPVYPNAIEALRTGGARPLSSPLADPLGDCGWDLDGIRATLKQASPRLAYLIPDFQNPTGFLMDDDDRAAYAAALREAGTVAVVDETLAATAHGDLVLPAPFAAHDPRAITIGSSSKTFWGGLRVGWIRAPRSEVEQLVATRVHLDLGSSLVDQLVVLELLRARDSVIPLRRQHLRDQRDALAAALGEHLPEWQFRLPEGGLALWVRIAEGSATRLSAAAARAGVHVVPGPVFAVDGGGDSWLRIPFTKGRDQLQEAVRVLAQVAGEARRERGRRPGGVLIA